MFVYAVTSSIVGVGCGEVVYLRDPVLWIVDIRVLSVVKQVSTCIVAVAAQTVVGERDVLVLIGPARGQRLLQEVTPGIVGEAQSPMRLVGRGQPVQLIVGETLRAAGVELVSHAPDIAVVFRSVVVNVIGQCADAAIRHGVLLRLQTPV